MTNVLVDEVDVPHLKSERDDLSLVALAFEQRGREGGGRCELERRPEEGEGGKLL